MGREGKPLAINIVIAIDNGDDLYHTEYPSCTITLNFSGGTSTKTFGLEQRK
jgi:hypothetical protein